MLGWNAAADVAKRALAKFNTPTKRGKVSTMLTVDQVSLSLDNFQYKHL